LVRASHFRGVYDRMAGARQLDCSGNALCRHILQQPPAKLSGKSSLAPPRPNHSQLVAHAAMAPGWLLTKAAAPATSAPSTIISDKTFNIIAPHGGYFAISTGSLRRGPEVRLPEGAIPVQGLPYCARGAAWLDQL
jgi:hypothetical protein